MALCCYRIGLHHSIYVLVISSKHTIHKPGISRLYKGAGHQRDKSGTSPGYLRDIYSITLNLS
jgi:hypothetical protein